jgi:hypothetical protein
MDPVPVTLDGKPKLLARSLAEPALVALEPGLELIADRSEREHDHAIEAQVQLMSRLPMLEPAEAYALWAPSYPAHAHNPVMQAEERAMLRLMPTGARRTCHARRWLRQRTLHAARAAARRGAREWRGSFAAMLDRADGAGWIPACAKVELMQGSWMPLPVPDARRPDGLRPGHRTS